MKHSVTKDDCFTKIGRPILEGLALDRNLGTSGHVGARAILNEHVFGAELDRIAKR